MAKKKPDVSTKPEARAAELMRADCRDAVQVLIKSKVQNRTALRDYIRRDLMLSVQAQCRVLGIRLVDDIPDGAIPVQARREE